MTALDIVLVTFGSIFAISSASLAYYRSRQNYQIELRRLNLEELRLHLVEDSKPRSNQEDDSILRQLVFQQNEVLQQLKRSQQNVVVNFSDQLRSQSATALEQVQDRSSMMKELSHSLNTPLSQIEAIALRGQGPGGKLSVDDLAKVRAAVDICKSFLEAFRDLANVADSATGWNPESLREAILSAADVYRDSTKREDVEVSVEMPERLLGYANSYVLSILLPILENAIEGASSQSHILVIAGSRDSEAGSVEAAPAFTIEVESRSDQPPSVSDEIYSSGFTTKAEHNGIGLGIARSLASMTSGASITHDVTGRTVVFTILLPKEFSA